MPLRPFTEAEVLAGRRALEVPLLLTVLLSAAMFALAEGNFVYLGIASVAVVLHLIAARWNVELYAHRAVLNIGVVVVGVILAVRYVTSDEDLLIALGHYVTLIQLCKLFERKRGRDYLQMLAMSFLLVMAGAMICQDLLFAAVGLLYVAVLAYTGAVFTVYRGMAGELAKGAGGPAGRRGQKAWPTAPVAGRMVVAMVVILAGGVAVFLAAPRSLGGAEAPFASARSSAEAGFVNSVRLGEPRSIYLSNRVVMHVRMRGPGGEDLGYVGRCYLRGRVFTDYVDSRWVRPRGRGRYLGMPVPAGILATCVRQEVSMVPSLLPVVFATHPAVKVVSPDAAVRRLTAMEYELTGAGGRDRPVRYTAYVLADRSRPVVQRYLADLARRAGGGLFLEGRNVQVTRPVADLANRWCEDLLARRETAGPAELDELDLLIARRIAQRLQQRCIYTLDLTDADPSRDGVEDFLFHLRRGHCEYFASAMTLMCQSLGVRARLATGFCPSEFDDERMLYIVRQGDAHAWTEVYTPATDWVVVDATPAERFEPEDLAGLAGWWHATRQAWRRWEFAWYANVVAYDDEARRRFVARWRGAALDAWGGLRDVGEEVWWGLVDLFAKGRISPAVVNFFLAVGLLAAGVAALLLLPRGRRARRRRRLRAPHPPAFFQHLAALLRRHGIRDEPTRTPRELADRAAETLALPREVLADLVALYYRIRWSGERVERAELRAAEARVRELAATLARPRRRGA